MGKGLIQIAGRTLALVGIAAGWPAQAAPGAAKLQVAVSIPPQKYFVERVGGDRVAVHVLVGAGESPATYEPKPSQLVALSRADVYFRIGVPFERTWASRFQSANPTMSIVDTAAGIERLTMATHDHGPSSVVEETADPHIWLSPVRVEKQVRTICETLVRLDPDGEPLYRKNLERVVSDLKQLDREIREALADATERRFLVFHPAWGYFAHDYGLHMVPVEVGGQEPSASELAEFIRGARDAGHKVLFAQPEFSVRSARTIAREMGGEVLLISPLAEDWLENMRKAARVFSDVLNTEKGTASERHEPMVTGYE